MSHRAPSRSLAPRSIRVPPVIPSSRAIPAVGLLLTAVAGFASAPAQAGSWYKGDLHLHSTYSDGDGTVQTIVDKAGELGLDFIAITDHDSSMSGNPSQWTDPAFFSGSALMLYGMEWTTGRGHANVWSAEAYDYQPLWEANRALDVTTAIESAHEAGGVFSINHPSDYDCCPWKYTSFDRIDAVEVWNGTFRLPAMNQISVSSFWDDLLLRGSQPTAVGGSDTHYWHNQAEWYKSAGNPTTWIYAESARAEDLLEGIRLGHVGISYAPEGVRAELLADADGDGRFEAMMGDEISAGRLTRFRLQTSLPGGSACTGRAQTLPTREGIARLAAYLPPTLLARALQAGPAAAEGRLLVIVRDGEVFKTVKLPCDGAAYEFEDLPSAGSYYRAELIGVSGLERSKQLAYGFTLAMTNPIFAW